MDPNLPQTYKPIDPSTMAGTPPKDLFANALGAHADGQNSQSGLSPGDTSQDSADGDGNSDAEGVWAPDIEQAFQEALAIYPPCGRRKIILSDEGKMYGRNELIARYIKLRTGKARTRKQVSSHIQVLARKKAREIQGKIKDQAAKEKAMAGLSTMSSAQIVSASSLQNAGAHRMFGGQPGIAGNAVPMHTMLSPTGPGGSPVLVKHELINPAAAGLIWHPTLSGQPGQPFIPSSSMATTMPQLQVARAAGPFVTAQQNSPDLLPQPPTSGDEGNVKVPFVIANPAAAAGDTPTAVPHLPPPNLPLKMVEFIAFVDKSKSENEADKKHGFVNISPSTSFTDPHMEAVDILHIADKFPEKNGGLKDLFEKGPRDRFFLVKFWADIDTDLLDDSKAFYGVTSQYESSDNMTISCSTKVCSFGKQVVEKVETEYARFDNGRFVYRINRSPMCDYMVSFIHRLKHLPERYMMNSVLENFTILQVVTNRDTQETLLCLAFVFEVCSSEDGSKHHIYRLIKSGSS